MSTTLQTPQTRETSQIFPSRRPDSEIQSELIRDLKRTVTDQRAKINQQLRSLKLLREQNKRLLDKVNGAVAR